MYTQENMPYIGAETHYNMCSGGDGRRGEAVHVLLSPVYTDLILTTV